MSGFAGAMQILYDRDFGKLTDSETIKALSEMVIELEEQYAYERMVYTEMLSIVTGLTPNEIVDRVSDLVTHLNAEVDG